MSGSRRLRRIRSQCSKPGSAVDGSAIRRVTDDERRAEHRGPIATREIVEDHDALAALDELADDVAADVTGTAGDEDGILHGTHVTSRAGEDL